MIDVIPVSTGRKKYTISAPPAPFFCVCEVQAGKICVDPETKTKVL